MNSESPSSLGRRRFFLFTAVLVVVSLLLIIGIYTDQIFMEFGSVLSEKNSSTTGRNKIFSLTHRKLLNTAGEQGKKRKGDDEREMGVGVVPNRIWSDKCSKSDIVISQGATEPLPNGIPTYTVEVMNTCVSGCDIAAIHLSCGWFSSARLVNPHVFKRLRFDDCLVNDGKPLRNGRTLSFQYANTFRYALSVSSVSC